jgi:hypothetical protein
VEPIAVTDAPGADAVPVQVPIDVVLSERIAVTDLPSVIGDTTPPVIFVPPSMTIEATSPGGAVVRFGLPTAKDPDDSAGPVTCAPQSGSTFPIGTETVTCTSVDTHGNVGSATFFVTVADTTPPILRLPPTITVDATSAQGAAVTYVASAVDAVSGMVPVTCGRVAGSRFPIGVTSVTCSASDGAGNVTKGAFDVVVLNPAQMIANLISAVRGQQQVLKLLQSAAASITQNDVPAACGQLTGFANQVSAQTGHGFSVAQAADLLGHAADIKATLGCR